MNRIIIISIVVVVYKITAINLYSFLPITLRM